MNRSFEVEIPASGQNLAGTFFPAQQDLGNQAVLLCPATGITQRFYFSFASWLSEQGFSVLVFDYRGIGRSLAESHVRHSTAKKQDWGLLDMPAALDFLLALTGQKAALLIGHSVGGQLFGLMHNHARLRGVLAVAASSGYVKNIRQDKRTAAKLMLSCVIPLSAMLLGYIPAKKLGWGKTCPKRLACNGPNGAPAPGMSKMILMVKFRIIGTSSSKRQSCSCTQQTMKSLPRKMSLTSCACLKWPRRNASLSIRTRLDSTHWGTSIFFAHAINQSGLCCWHKSRNLPESLSLHVCSCPC